MTPMGEAPLLRLYQDARRFRAFFGDTLIADSCQAVQLCEGRRHPVIYFPRSAVKEGCLHPSTKRTTCPLKGEAGYWSLQVGGRQQQDAAWSYETPLDAVQGIAGHIAFEWSALDALWHEEQELLAHPRNPYIRIDTLKSERRVVVRAAGQVLADSRRAVLLFETGLPMRVYLPKDDVAMDLLSRSATTSVCPYKGQAAYYTAELGGRQFPDLAWTYERPFDEVALVKDHLAFYPERVDSIEIAAT